jgi:hypothetical protein
MTIREEILKAWIDAGFSCENVFDPKMADVAEAIFNRRLKEIAEKDMKASELRIGNLYVMPELQEDLSYTGKVFKIDSIAIRDAERDKEYWPGKPIRLTDEWLIRFDFDNGDKLGFEKYEWVKRIPHIIDEQGHSATLIIGLGEDEGSYLLTKWDDHEDATWLPIIVKYVDQLQNLYWCLCGEELTIKEEQK